MKKILCRTGAVLLSLALVLGSLYLLQRLVTPKYVDQADPAGAFIAEYYDEVKDHDLIFLGDCEVYGNFSPAALWERCGINSYIRGSADQYVFQSYYLLEDTLRYETPRAVVFNVQALQYSYSRSEAYNRMTLDGMAWSKYKAEAIRASMPKDLNADGKVDETQEERFIDYLFPLLRYHSRWSELTDADFSYLFSTPKVTHNGYFMQVKVKPAGEMPPVRPLADYSFGERAWEYLDRMADCCAAHGVQLILIKAPSLYPHWYEQWDEQVADYAEKKGIPYINFLDHIEEIGLDYSLDTYDGGLHMNLTGAEKCAAWLGGILQSEYGLPDRRGEKDLAARWQEKLTAYRAEAQAQREQNGMEQ